MTEEQHNDLFEALLALADRLGFTSDESCPRCLDEHEPPGGPCDLCQDGSVVVLVA